MAQGAPSATSNQLLHRAIQEYRLAISLSPSHFDAENNLGTALALAGDESGAIAHLRNALRLNPNLETAHFNLGNALLSTGDLNGAATEFRAALQLDPNDSDAANNLKETLRLQTAPRDTGR